MTARDAATDARPDTTAPRALDVPPNATIYHQPWWLDATTDGRWTLVTTDVRGGFVARMPTFQPRGLLASRMSLNPPLTRTLGPVFDCVAGEAALSEDTARRLTTELAAQLPRGMSFAQVFAPDARGLFGFAQAGFTLRADYTYWLAASAWPAGDGQAWRRVHPKTRRQIRRAQERYGVDRAVSVDEFVAFYGSAKRLDGRALIPDAAAIRTLLTAAHARSSCRLLGCRSADGRLVSAAFVAFDQHTAHLVMTARDASVADSGAVGLLVWDAALWALMSGYAFDFDGDAHFLSQFGGEPRLRWKVQRLRTSDRALRWARLI